jgi:hypothetical protein
LQLFVAVEDPLASRRRTPGFFYVDLNARMLGHTPHTPIHWRAGLQRVTPSY